MLLLQRYTENLWRYGVFGGVGLTLMVKAAIFYQTITVRRQCERVKVLLICI